MKLFVAFCLAALPLAAAEVWIAPPGTENGAHFRELFEHPDEWRETRSRVDVLFYADHNLDRQFTDDELRAWFAKMAEWKIRFGMEVGAIKEWGQTGEKTFSVERGKWERFEHLGGNIHAIAMDEPFLCARKKLKKTDEYAVNETAAFIALVRRQFPKTLIGDIETYPSVPIADHRWWIETLNKRLAEMGVRGLDFYRLDVNWAVFNVLGQGSWREVKTLEQYCRSKALPFSLIYWASDYPALLRRKLAADDTWYVSIMRQGYDYAMVGGAPDQFVIESWVGAPSRSVPETDDFTFTRSVRDFVRKFVTDKR